MLLKPATNISIVYLLVAMCGYLILNLTAV